MDKEITLSSPKIEYKKRYRGNASEFLYSYRDYSSCMDIFTLEFRRYLKTATTFWNEIFTD